ncbi:hypothetical protein D3C80_1490210 [compost metagenome]
MHGAPQVIQRAGDGQGHQQAEQGQYHQGNSECAERPEQAVTVPGGQFAVRDAVDEQVGFAGLRAAVVGGQAAPGQALVILLACLEGGGAGWEGASDQGLAVVVEHLHVEARGLLALLEKGLGGAGAPFFIKLGPGFGQTFQGRVLAENPGVLVQRPPQQHG